MLSSGLNNNFTNYTHLILLKRTFWQLIATKRKRMFASCWFLLLKLHPSRQSVLFCFGVFVFVCFLAPICYLLLLGLFFHFPFATATIHAMQVSCWKGCRQPSLLIFVIKMMRTAQVKAMMMIIVTVLLSPLPHQRYWHCAQQLLWCSLSLFSSSPSMHWVWP